MNSKNKELRTSQQWQEEYPNIRIINPDGWDRKNFQHSWYEELIDYDEYCKRVAVSTCSIKLIK